jgi:hypothetical protein
MSLNSPHSRRIAPEGLRWRVVQGLIVGLIMSGGAFAALRLPSSSATPPGSEIPVAVVGDRSTPENVLPRSVPSLSGRIVTFTETLSNGDQSIISHDLGTGIESVIASPLSPSNLSVAGTPWTLINSSPDRTWAATDGTRSVALPDYTVFAAVSTGTAASIGSGGMPNTAFTLTTLSGGDQRLVAFPSASYYGYAQSRAVAIEGTSVAVISNSRGVDIFDGATWLRTIPLDNGCFPSDVQFVGSLLRFAGYCYSGEVIVGSADRLGTNVTIALVRLPDGTAFGGGRVRTAFGPRTMSFVNGNGTGLVVYDPSTSPAFRTVYTTSGSLAGVGMPDDNKVIFGETVMNTDGRVEQRVLELYLRTGQLVKLVPGGQQDIVRPVPNLNRDPDVSAGTVAYVSQVDGRSRIVTRSLAGGSSQILTETSTGIGTVRLGSNWALYDEKLGDVVGVKRSNGARVSVAKPLEPPYGSGLFTTFDTRGNEAIVSTITSGSLAYWAFIRDLSSSRTTWSTPSSVDTYTIDGPSVDASDAGFLVSRTIYGPNGGSRGVVLRSLTGVETFSDSELTPSSNGWLTGPNGYGGIVSEPKVCRFPCATIETFSPSPGWESQDSIAVAGSKVLLIQTSPYFGTNYGLDRAPTRVVAFDRKNPTAAPVVLMQASGTFSQLRADGDDIVFSLRRFVAGVDVSTVYAYNATTGKLRAVTP